MTKRPAPVLKDIPVRTRLLLHAMLVIDVVPLHPLHPLVPTVVRMTVPLLAVQVVSIVVLLPLVPTVVATMVKLLVVGWSACQCFSHSNF